MNRRHSAAALLAVLCAGFFSTQVTAAPADKRLPPIEHFTRPPAHQTVRISPNGDLLATTLRKEDFEGVAVLQRSTLQPIAVQKYRKDSEVFDLQWANNEILLVSPGIRSPGRTDYVYPTGELLALNVKTKQSETLYGQRAGEQQTGTHIRKRESKRESARLVHLLPEQRDHVLIQTTPLSLTGNITQLHRMNVRNGKLLGIAKAEDIRTRFVTDDKGTPALRIRYDSDNSMHIERKLKNGYESLSSFQPGKGWLRPWHAATDDKYFAFDERESATSAVSLMKLDGSTNVLYHNPDLEPERFLIDRDRRVWGVRFAGAFPQYFYPDPKDAVAHMHQRLRKTFSELDVDFTSFSDDRSYAIAFVHGDTDPGRYYLVDFEKGGLVELLDSRPWLVKEDLSPMQPVEIKARDGKKIIAMLTLPKPTTEKQTDALKPPAVVLVHGGPHGVYDRWGFDSVVQLLASRGYAVLQVNYRGSGGYGEQFKRAGFGEWGALMQQDVTDATLWAASSGVVDRKRICIMGGSYGAYSALTGAFQQPDLYRCAVGYAGVYDLPLLFEKGDVRMRNSGVNYLRDTLGENTEEMRKRSPVSNAGKIKARVFLAHGGLDMRAPPAHAKRLRRELTKAGNKPVWMFREREGHGFFGAENRTEFYTNVLAFLDKELKE